MKTTLIFISILLSALTVNAQQSVQESTITTVSISELQASEFATHFNLDETTKQKAIQINELCSSKIAGLQSTGMEQNAIDEGIAYNKDLRLQSLKALLTPKQQETFSDFVMNSQYNQ